VEYQENFTTVAEYVCPVGSFIFCPTVKIEIQSLLLLSLITMGPESRIQLLFVF
jgi:hypothetical protein